MKNLTQKFSAIIVTLAMLMTLTVTAFAANIKSNDAANKYDVYQIFTGIYADGILTNLKWGANGTGTQGAAVEGTVADALTAVNSKSDKEKLAEIQKYANLAGTPAYTIDGAQTIEVADGYYLIKDQKGSVASNDAYTLYVVAATGELTIQRKSGIPTMNKKIQDTNDSIKDDTTGWQDSADYDIGDEVPLKLTGTLPENYADYDNFYYAFHDVEEEGLTFKKDSVVVKVDGTEISKDLYKVVTEDIGSETFEVIIPDVKTTSATKDSKITVEYKSVLNEDAHTGNYGEVNEAWLEYANNPNDTTPKDENGKPSETGETAHDSVIVFTYKVVINKVDEAKEALEGAEFTLSKKLADGTTKAVGVVKNDAGTTFTFNGLDDGIYVLEETVTPKGYNTMDPVTFEVKASHNTVWEGEERTTILTSLTGTATTGEIDLTAALTEGSLTADVVNYTGATLPTTGGMGTVIFYALGGLLVLAAGILMVAKIRTSKEN